MGCHHLGDLYTTDRRIKGERALKEWAPARKGIPGLKAWLARHSAVLAPLLRVPPPPPARWRAAPKDWIPSAVPAYPAKAVIGGRVAKTTRVETMYHTGSAIKVTTAMKDTMEAKDWAPQLRVCCQPPNTLPSNTRLHRLVVALLGVQVQVNAPLHAPLWDDHQHASLGVGGTKRGGVGTHHRLAGPTAGGRVLAMGPILQPVAQRCWGKLALVPVGHREEKGERAAEERSQVHLWRLPRRRIYADVQVRYPVRRRSNHVDGRGRGETSASQDRGVEVVYAIPTMASGLICPEGSHCRLGVRYQPKYPWLLHQPADV